MPGIASFLLVLLLNFSWIAPSKIFPKWIDSAHLLLGLSSGQLLSSLDSESGLREVSPPGSVQRIRNGLNKHHPKLNVEYPSPDALLTDELSEKWELVLSVEDWPLYEDSEIGLGPHIVIQIDDSEPIRITQILSLIHI